MEVAPDRAVGVDRDGEFDRVGRVDLVEVAPDRAGRIDRDGDVVVVDSEGAKVEEGTSLVFERLREDHSEWKTEVLVHLKMLNRRVWKD